MKVVGVDENGLGPRLGPLVVTAALGDVETYHPERVQELATRAGIGDSKTTGGFGRMAACESLAVALVRRTEGQVPTSLEGFLDAVLLDGPLAIRSLCPTASAPQCWREPVTLPAFGGTVAAGEAMLKVLDGVGFRLTRVRSRVACARALNLEFAAGTSKLVVNLGHFEALLLDARRAAGADLHAVCGMVGGIRRYPERFRSLRASDVTEQSEGRGFADYTIASLGRVRFEVGADAGHAPVSVASMVGKYVRELWMERQNRFYSQEAPGLPRPSGYHDPVTRRFIEESGPVRRRLHIDPSCFERTR